MSTQKRDLLRRGNSDLAGLGIFVWSIPALVAKSEKFGRIKTCPNAGICAALCYARTGRYRFRGVLNSHTRNLEEYISDPFAWKQKLQNELKARKFRPTGRVHSFDWETRKDFDWWVNSGGKAVRIHDAGDFFSYRYLLDWLEIADKNPNILFYTYSKQVSDIKKANKEGKIPKNFVVIFSMGGQQDALIDTSLDRHDDIFPNLQALTAAGYEDQEKSDLMAALLPTKKIGIVANKIPQLLRRQGTQSFSLAQKNGLKAS